MKEKTIQEELLERILDYAKDDNIEIKIFTIDWNKEGIKEIHDDITQFLEKLKEFEKKSRESTLRFRYQTPVPNYS